MFDGAPTYPPRLCFRGWVRGPIGMFYGDNCNHLDSVGFDVCLYSSNPNYGSTHFDNFAAALLIVFQVTTFEGWALIMKWTGATTGLGADAYFVVLCITGGYFMVNIYVAVVSAVFLKVRHQHRVLIKRYRKDKTLSFANAVLMATVLKEVIESDDAKLNWTSRFRRNTTRLSHELTQSLSRQGTKIRRTMSKAVDWNDPNSYLKRLSSFGLTSLDTIEQVQPEDPALPRSLSRNLSRTLSRNLSYVARFGRTFSRSVSMRGQSVIMAISSRCWIIVHSKVFDYGTLFFISLNMAALCSLKANMSRRHTYHIRILTEEDAYAED
ncbi:hypothetical protein R1flu_010760 [Riccia fluitans]|uniref:Ion transport domain-containing protein n=1 Tax=Riccia fluitans TaxID=41844 RepID=A0ABD1Z6U0_9MARC